MDRNENEQSAELLYTGGILYLPLELHRTLSDLSPRALTGVIQRALVELLYTEREENTLDLLVKGVKGILTDSNLKHAEVLRCLEGMKEEVGNIRHLSAEATSLESSPMRDFDLPSLDGFSLDDDGENLGEEDSLGSLAGLSFGDEPDSLADDKYKIERDSPFIYVRGNERLPFKDKDSFYEFVYEDLGDNMSERMNLNLKIYGREGVDSFEYTKPF